MEGVTLRSSKQTVVMRLLHAQRSSEGRKHSDSGNLKSGTDSCTPGGIRGRFDWVRPRQQSDATIQIGVTKLRQAVAATLSQCAAEISPLVLLFRCHSKHDSRGRVGRLGWNALAGDEADELRDTLLHSLLGVLGNLRIGRQRLQQRLIIM